MKMTVFNQYFLIITSLIYNAKNACCQLIKVRWKVSLLSLTQFWSSFVLLWLITKTGYKVTERKMSHQSWLEEFFQSKNQFIKTTFSIGSDWLMIFNNTQSDLKVLPAASPQQKVKLWFENQKYKANIFSSRS